MRLDIIILAGGMGKRMNSDLPKVLHNINNKPMLLSIIETSRKLNPKNIYIVVGKFKELIINTIKQYTSVDNIHFVEQPNPLGTGDAIKQTLNILNLNNDNLILNGDTPLLTEITLKQIISDYYSKNSKIQITGINLNNPFGNGRIVLENNEFVKIVEEKDCNITEKLINLVNCGIYIVKTKVLLDTVPLINNNNIQNEYYLTDIVEIYKNKFEGNIDLYILDKDKSIEISNINTFDQLNELKKLINNL